MILEIQVIKKIITTLPLTYRSFISAYNNVQAFLPSLPEKGALWSINGLKANDNPDSTFITDRKSVGLIPVTAPTLNLEMID